MKVLIVYDSFFGNTEKIAQAIGGALAPAHNVEVRRIGDAKPAQLTGTELLIVGSPTRGFRPSPATTEFLKSLPTNALKGVRVGAFDTRIATSDIGSPILRAMVNLGGYAAKRIAGDLKKKGGELAVPPEGFFVQGEQGPLKEGEIERAANWAKSSVATAS